MPDLLHKNNTRITSLAELFLYFDEEYVVAAYHFFLGRDPDPEGMGNYLELLRSGTPRHKIASTICKSPEAQRRRGVPSNADGKRLGTDEDTVQLVVANLTEVCCLNDRAFIAAAYHMVLGREPDDEGMSNYLLQLRSGRSKPGLLSSMVKSPEFKVRKQLNANCVAAAEVSGKCGDLEPRTKDLSIVALAHDLNRMAIRYSFGQLPIVGWFFRILFDIEGESEPERRLRRMENQLYLLSSRDFSAIEESTTLDHYYQSHAAIKCEKVSQTGDDFACTDNGAQVTTLRSVSSRLRTLNAHTHQSEG